MRLAAGLAAIGLLVGGSTRHPPPNLAGKAFAVTACIHALQNTLPAVAILNLPAE